MTPTQILTAGGTLASLVAAVVVVLAAARTSSARVWREEAEAQKTRADRLESSLSEIKERLSRIEAENKRLISLLTSLDPNRLAVLRLAANPQED
ncbi:hypothetical protein ACFC1D_05100 [Streptomyces vinaceus]|uniref:hypothetical protein n=1 Tax=Streptomyces vinaceus TaxID=1960 RepID=UPI0035DC0224